MKLRLLWSLGALLLLFAAYRYVPGPLVETADEYELHSRYKGGDFYRSISRDHWRYKGIRGRGVPIYERRHW